MTLDQKKALYQRFCSVLTHERQQKFEQVWNQRNTCLHLVLENIYQSLNASAIVRTADAMGVQYLHVLEDEHLWEMNRKISKGAMDWMDIQRSKDPREMMLSLKSKGFELVVTDFSPNSIDIEDYQPKRPVALVMGTELTGISDVARELADVQVVIPMSGFSQSLNVSVATGIAVSQLSRKTMHLKTTFPPTDEERLDALILWSKNAIYWSDQIIRDFLVENHQFHLKLASS
jgi:tRNA (guanosine-2'-O-)-methyltransferase